MRFDYRTYLQGGEIIERSPSSHERKFTRVLPLADTVLTPHEAGDLIAAWAMTMCLRDTLVRVESTFPNFVIKDKVEAKDRAMQFENTSQLVFLDWWQDKLPTLIELERKLVANEFVSLSVDWEHGLALVTAINWFIERYRCRPPGVGEGLHNLGQEIEKEVANASGGDLSNQSMTSGGANAGGMEGLSVADRRAVESLRAFEEDDFGFLADLGLMSDDTKSEQEDDDTTAKAGAAMAELTAEINATLGSKKFAELDDVDKAFVTAARAIGEDGFRDEDRAALDRFRAYVTLAVRDVPPMRSRWLQGSHIALGQRLFAFGQLLFASSFPNAEAAKLREEEIAANRARLEREAEEKASKARYGG